MAFSMGSIQAVMYTRDLTGLRYWHGGKRPLVVTTDSGHKMLVTDLAVLGIQANKSHEPFGTVVFNWKPYTNGYEPSVEMKPTFYGIPNRKARNLFAKFAHNALRKANIKLWNTRRFKILVRGSQVVCRPYRH